MTETSAGLTFEARAHRLFLAQGSFAERGLLPSATPDRRMLATDIDVLVSEYGSGFHLTRRHVECKSGKFSLLDRILWLNGVRYAAARGQHLLDRRRCRSLGVRICPFARRGTVYRPASGRVGKIIGYLGGLVAVPKRF